MFCCQRYLELQQTGLIDHWRSEITGGQAQCYISNLMGHKPTKLRRITTADLASAFFILAIGCSLSLLCFLAEICWRKIRV